MQGCRGQAEGVEGGQARQKSRCGPPGIVQVQELRTGMDSTVWPETGRDAQTLEHCSCGTAHPRISLCKVTVVQLDT